METKDETDACKFAEVDSGLVHTYCGLTNGRIRCKGLGQDRRKCPLWNK